MDRQGYVLSFVGFMTSLLSTILIFNKTTNTSLQDVSSIVFGYLSLTILGLCITVLGVAIIIYKSN